MVETTRDAEVARIAAALHGWGYDCNTVIRDEIKEPTANQIKAAERIVATLRSTSRDSEVREALRAVLTAFDIPPLEGPEWTTAEVEHHWLTKDRQLMEALRNARAILGRSSEAAPTPKRERTDWSNVVVDEGDEAP